MDVYRFEAGSLGLARPRAWAAAITADLLALLRARDVVRCLVWSQLTSRYHDSVLGFLWSLLNPLLMLGIMTVVFSQILHFQMEHFFAYLFAGTVPWSFFQQSVQTGGGTLIANQALIRKVRVSKLVFPVADVIGALVNMAFSMAALFFIVLIMVPVVHPQLCLIIPATALFAAFTFGVVLAAMTLVTYFRDLNHIIAAGLQAMYFVTPLFYPKEALGRLVWIAELNPVAHFIALYHAAIYYGTWPPLGDWLWCTGSATASLAVGYAVFKWREHDFIFRL